MKHFLIQILLLCMCTGCSAESRTVNKQVICDSKQVVFQAIINDFEERPVWRGFNPLQRTELMITVNPKNGHWTLVEYKDDWACVIGVGENSSSAWGTPA